MPHSVKCVEETDKKGSQLNFTADNLIQSNPKKKSLDFLATKLLWKAMAKSKDAGPINEKPRKPHLEVMEKSFINLEDTSHDPMGKLSTTRREMWNLFDVDYSNPHHR